MDQTIAMGVDTSLVALGAVDEWLGPFPAQVEHVARVPVITNGVDVQAASILSGLVVDGFRRGHNTHSADPDHERQNR